MLAHRVTVAGETPATVAFSGSSSDLQGLRPGFAESLGHLEGECGVRFARMNQVHGDRVVAVTAPEPDATSSPAEADGLVTSTRGVGLMVRVADCVPVVLADTTDGVVGVAHAGRVGMALGVVGRTVEAMQRLGARHVHAWIGPHICGRCYEVPERMRDEVAISEPASAATTRWGTPSIDLAAGVTAQLDRLDISWEQIDGCTLEDVRWHSHRRDAQAAGRQAGVVWLHP